MKRIRSKKLSVFFLAIALMVTSLSIAPVISVSADGNIKIQMSNNNTNPQSGSINPRFMVVNSGSSNINLADVKIRYFFTKDGAKDQNFWCDWSPVGSANVTGKFYDVSPAVTGADCYLEISFASGAGTLDAGKSIEVQSRFAKSDWSNYNQSDDYSFQSTTGNPVDWDKVAAYIGSQLQWGTDPTQKVIEPTPTVTIFPTPSVNPTPTDSGDPEPTVQQGKTTISGLNASIDLSTKLVTISGKISSGEGKQVTLRVIDPDQNDDFIYQATSGANGVFSITYTTQNTVKGTYTVRASGLGVASPALTTFDYNEGVTPTPSETPSDIDWATISFNVDTSFEPATLVPNKMFTAKITATNNSDVSYTGKADVLVIVGLFDSKNTMVNVSYISKGIGYHGTETLSAGFKLPSDLTGMSVRAFMWDGNAIETSNLIPLSNEVHLP